MSWSENLVVKLRGIPVPEIVGADGSRVYLYFVPLRSHKEEEILILDLFQQFHKGITYSVSLQGSVDGKSKNLTPKPPDKDYTGSQFCSLWGQQSFPEGVDLTAQPFDLQVWVFPYSFDSKTGQDVMTTGTLVYRQEMTIENAIHTSL